MNKTRQKIFQKSFNWEEEKHMREHFAVNLRKSKRKDCQKKRRVAFLCENLSKISLKLPSNYDLNTLTEELRSSSDIRTLSFIIKTFIDILQSNINYTKAYMEIGLTGILCKYLNFSYSDELIENATSLLCMMTEGDEFVMNHLDENGVIEGFLIMLDSENQKIQENALISLGNFIAHSEDYFAKCVQQGVLKKLRKISKISVYNDLIKLLAWIIKSISSYQDELGESHIKAIIEIAKRIIKDTDNEAVEDTIYAVSYLSKKDTITNCKLIEEGIVEDALQRIQSNPIPTLNLILNICADEENFNEFLMQMGLLDKLDLISGSDNQEVKANFFWALSNFSAGGVRYCSFLMKHSLFNKTLEISYNQSPELYLRQCKYIYSLLRSCSFESQKSILLSGILQNFIKVVPQVPDNILVLLNISKIFFEYSSTEGFCCSDVYYFVNSMADSANKTVRKKAIEILEIFPDNHL